MNNLQQIGLKYFTDKALYVNYGKSYLDIYETYFKDIRNEKLNVLEIGVKTGNSIRVWEEYFPNSNIFGLDIDPSCKQYQTNRTKIIIGSQGDEATINEALKLANNKFDIIIDDGAHINHLIIKSYELLFDRLSSNGLYIIEDLANTYYKDIKEQIIVGGWPGMKYNKDYEEFVNDRETMDEFFKNIIHEVDGVQNVQYVHFYPWISIIRKK